MAEKQYLITFRLSKRMGQHVAAAKVEIQGDHLVFVDSQGKLAGLFLLEIVESCNEVTHYLQAPVA